MRLSDLSIPKGMTRRHFMQHLTTTSLALPAMAWFQSLTAAERSGKKTNKSCILLWMSGGPSQLDTWDPKPDSPKGNGGLFKGIDTAISGIQISEGLPLMAQQMKHVSLIRSMDTKEGNHDRGRYLMHTGYIPNPTVIHPSFGSSCSYVLGPKMGDFPLPHFISISEPSMGSGFLGMAHSPFVVQNPGSPIANLRPSKDVTGARFDRRLKTLEMVEQNFISQKRGQFAEDHQEVYHKTVRMMNSKYTKAFNIEDEPAKVRERYGKTAFGNGCLMARRLVEAGVTFVEVGLGGWDTHAAAQAALAGRGAGMMGRGGPGLLPTLDQGMSALIEDLAQHGLLENTVVAWMGEFGRTPRINQNAGRDHWPQSWSVVLGGGGIKGGQAIGKTDADGVEILDQPIHTMDVIATMAKAMGIPLDTTFTTPNGRPIPVVRDGEPIKGLI